MSLKALWRDYCENTTFHGFAYWTKSGTFTKFEQNIYEYSPKCVACSEVHLCAGTCLLGGRHLSRIRMRGGCSPFHD